MLSCLPAGTQGYTAKDKKRQKDNGSSLFGGKKKVFLQTGKLTDQYISPQKHGYFLNLFGMERIAAKLNYTKFNTEIILNQVWECVSTSQILTET